MRKVRSHHVSEYDTHVEPLNTQQSQFNLGASVGLNILAADIAFAAILSGWVSKMVRAKMVNDNYQS